MELTTEKNITERELGLIDVVRLNNSMGIKYILHHRIKIGNINIKIEWRSKKNLWGRFGGGWNWKLGLQAGGSTIILDCLVFTLRFSKQAKKST
jgi:hypothetical protein